MARRLTLPISYTVNVSALSFNVTYNWEIQIDVPTEFHRFLIGLSI
ncbi:MAG: hypothetical protein U0V70_02515 [Terriglobia bacterium]